MLGYTAADVMNKITPADISDPQEVIARAKTLSVELGTPIAPGFEALVFKASRGIEDIYELTYIRKDGSRFPAVVSVTALRDAQDAIIGYLLIGTDNTARKQIEAEQKKLDQRLRDHQFYTRSLIESNIDAIMATDPSGIITDVNKQMEALTDCTRDELIGAPFKNYFTDPERAEAGIKRVLSEKKSPTTSSPRTPGTARKRWCPSTRPPSTIGTGGCRACSPLRATSPNANAWIRYCRKRTPSWRAPSSWRKKPTSPNRSFSPR
jgi:PAS domain S-box-containing protein